MDRMWIFLGYLAITKKLAAARGKLELLSLNSPLLHTNQSATSATSTLITQQIIDIKCNCSFHPLTPTYDSNQLESEQRHCQYEDENTLLSVFPFKHDVASRRKTNTKINT